MSGEATILSHTSDWFYQVPKGETFYEDLPLNQSSGTNKVTVFSPRGRALTAGHTFASSQFLTPGSLKGNPKTTEIKRMFTLACKSKTPLR